MFSESQRQSEHVPGWRMAELAILGLVLLGIKAAKRRVLHAEKGC